MKAEKLLNFFSILLVFIGFCVFCISLVDAVFAEQFNWMFFGIGAGVFVSSLVLFSFFQVIINISRKLDK